MSERSDSIAEMKKGKEAIEVELRNLIQTFMRKYGVEVEGAKLFVSQSHGLPPTIAQVSLDVRIP